MKSSENKSVLQRMGLATMLMVASVFLSRIVGFVREIIIASQQGATGDTDAYFAAFTLPDMMNYFLAGGTLSITFIPLFSAYLARGDEEGGWDLFSTIATGVGALTLTAVIVAEIFAPELVSALVPGFSADKLALCVRMTRIVTPAMLCFTVGGLLQATLMSRENFRWVAPIPVIYNLGIILGGVALGPWLGVEGFAWGALAGAIIGPLALPLWASREVIKYRPRVNFRSKGFRTYLTLAMPLMLGVSLVSLDEWLLRYFASDMADGTISWLNNARRLMLVPVAIIGQAASQAALPFLSRLHAQDDLPGLAHTLTEGLRKVLFYAVIASAALALLSQPIVFAAFRRGEFTNQDASQTAVFLTIFALGITAWSVQNLIARGYYARQNTWQPMLIGSVVVLLTFPLYHSLGHSYGGMGLAIASSIGITLNASVMLIIYRIFHAPITLGHLASSLLRALLCTASGTALMFALLWPLGDMQSDEGLPWILLRLGLGGLGYGTGSLGMAAAIRAPELAFVVEIIQKVKKKLGR